MVLLCMEVTGHADCMTLFSAIRLASRAHKDQWRWNGQAFIEHPLSVLRLLWDLSLDLPTNVYIAAVLHDVLVDTKIDYEELNEIVGSDISAVVRMLTKDMFYYSLPAGKREKMYLERIKSMSKIFPYALLIKMTDRLHNLQTSECLPQEKRSKLIRETKHLYIPLLEEHIYTLEGSLRTLYVRSADKLKNAVNDATHDHAARPLRVPSPQRHTSLCR